MIKKIIFSGIFVCLLIAIPLAMLGIRRVNLGGPFLSFMASTDRMMRAWAIPDIPSIPFIPKGNDNGTWWLILNAFIDFANFFVMVLNVITNIINIVIEIWQFFVTMLINFRGLKDSLAGQYIAPVPVP